MGGDATPARATFTLAVFFCINLLNYSDRQAVSGVLPLLLDGKSNGLGADVSSTQGGMLTTAFIIVYMCVSPVFGYLADRAPSRKLLVMVGLTLWAIASGLSSIAPSYATLLAARAAVGVGEASYNTVAPVIISDMYPPAERTAKLAVFYIAIPLGSAMGFMIGGQVGDMLGWRWALRVTPALLVLLTVFAVPLVHDPERGASEGAGKGPVAGEAGSGIRGWWRDVSSVLSVPSMSLSIIGQAGCNFAIGAITVWIPTTVTMIEGGPSVVAARGGISPTLVFGAVTVVSGLTGIFCSSSPASSVPSSKCF
jgi:MFS family permease